jgi:hypothetical protein
MNKKMKQFDPYSKNDRASAINKTNLLHPNSFNTVFAIIC